MIPLLGIFLASLKIRAYQPADENAVLALCTRCGLVSPDSNSLADIHRKLAVQPELFLVGTLDSAIIASGMAGYDGHRGYLYYLAVSPEHQRRGYGRAVVTHVQVFSANVAARNSTLSSAPTTSPRSHFTSASVSPATTW
jgi:ribosomal protein S18 acetylase RimI-like enzyme